MTAPPRVVNALLLFTLTVTAACTPQETVRISPSPTAAPTTAAPTTAVPTRSSPPTTPPSPSPAPTAAPTTSPGSTPNVACAPQTGGADANRVLLTAIRIAHNPGFDRLVFEFSPTDRGVGSYGVPPYLIEVASSFSGPSGQPVTVAGNAYLRVRFRNTDAHTDAGQVTLASSDLKPTTPLIKEVRIVEDFEATVQAAVGLDHLACPSVLTLTGPVRVVLDFPTPP